ncbi:MAG TPA: MBL fold metallo-hydrolase [Bacillales bacterium]|nr:MBL fold metallo-hydrolase [Bacillales bacterium]
MRVADGVEALELTTQVMGNQMTIYPTLIWDQDTVILVDTGMPGQLDLIRKAMDQADVPFSKLDKVIITHQDIDHIGGLPEVLDASDHKVEVLAHQVDKPYIEGEKTPIKMNPERASKMLEKLPEEQRNQMKAMYENPPSAGVDTTVADGEKLPHCGGITVIFTPGHTPGHISLYLNESKTLVTGDALIAQDGKLIGLNEQATPDMETAVKSLKKFVPYDIETVICYHGGVCTGNVNEQIADLAGK